MVKVGDAVRLKPESPLRAVLPLWADAVGRVTYTHQDDDDDGLSLTVSYFGPPAADISPLSADDFEIDIRRPAEPF